MSEEKGIVQGLKESVKEKSKRTDKKPEISGSDKNPEETGTEIKILKQEHKHVIRCDRCGQFLCEIVTEFALLRVRCRRTECKMVNVVTIDNNSVSYTTEQKEVAIRY